MRAVFVRRRAEARATPAWMGGLNYEECAMPKLPWNIDKRALSSDLASALQTRVHTGVSDFEIDDAHDTCRAQRLRPHTSGRMRLHSAGEPSSRVPLSARERRPQTAGAQGQLSLWRSSHSLDAHVVKVHLQDSSAMEATLRVSKGSLSEAQRTGRIGSVSARQRRTPAHAQPSHTLHTNIIGVGGAGLGAQLEADNGLFSACISLALDGTRDGAAQTHVSKPIKFTNDSILELPESWMAFELEGNVNRMLMAVKIHRKSSDSSKHGHTGEVGIVIGSCLLDLGSVLKAGGSKVEVCKLTHGKMGKKSIEVHLDLRLVGRKTDFDYAWVDGIPVFKKAGFVVSSAGILAPHSWVQRKEHIRKATHRPNMTLQELSVTDTIRDDQLVVVCKGCRIVEGAPTTDIYTLKRFPVMDLHSRRQLVSELDGLLEVPAHFAVQPVDCFLDKLEAVLVLDNEGGRYLSESVAQKGPMPERLVSIVVRQVLAVLIYLHSEKMRVHNNITAENILVLRSGEVRIGGFAFSSKAFMGHMSCRFAGDWAHLAPERLLGLECGFKADVWSVGILALGLIIGACPYDMSRFQGLTAIFDFKQAVVQEPSPSLRRDGEHTEDARLFVDSCLNKNLKLRSDSKGLIVHQFITKYESLTPNYLARWLNRSGKKRKQSAEGEALPESPLAAVQPESPLAAIGSPRAVAEGKK